MSGSILLQRSKWNQQLILQAVALRSPAGIATVFVLFAWKQLLMMVAGALGPVGRLRRVTAAGLMVLSAFAVLYLGVSTLLVCTYSNDDSSIALCNPRTTGGALTRLALANS